MFVHSSGDKGGKTAHTSSCTVKVKHSAEAEMLVRKQHDKQDMFIRGEGLYGHILSLVHS